jgi:hypothetical protein
MKDFYGQMQNVFGKTFEPLLKIANPGKEKENAEAVKNVDIQLVDKDHVIPNMGTVIFKAVWFSRLNMYEEV